MLLQFRGGMAAFAYADVVDAVRARMGEAGVVVLETGGLPWLFGHAPADCVAAVVAEMVAGGKALAAPEPGGFCGR